MASALVVATLALLGGSYDIVIRQEIAIVMWWILGLGVATGLLLPWRRGWLLWGPVAALTLMGVWTAISLEWTESSSSTVAEIARITGYVGLLLLVLLTVRPETTRAAVGGAATAAAAVCALALADRLTGSTLSNVDVINQAGASRLSYPLNYWNAMGTWAAMTLALALAAAIHERKTYVRAIALAVVPVAAATAYLTYSRTSIAGIVLGIVVVLVASRRRWTAVGYAAIGIVASALVIYAIRSTPAIADGTGTQDAATVAAALVIAIVLAVAGVSLLSQTRIDRWKLPRRTGRIAAATLVVVVVVGGIGAAVAVYPTVKRQFNNETVVATGNDPAGRLTSFNGNRTKVWSSAIAAFEAHPATGVGAGAFDLWWNRDARNGEFVRDAHSIYLEALAEIGVPGLLFVLLFAGSLLALVVVSRLRAPPGRREAGARVGALAVLAVFLVAAGVDWFWESTAITALALIVAGASGAALAPERRRPGIPVRVGAVVVALLACAIELPGLVSTSEVRNSQAAMRRGDLPAAISAAQDARDSAPWAVDPIMQQALIAEAVGQYDAAQRLLEQAVAVEPTNFRPEVLLARVAAENGDLATARAAYRRARALRPLSPLFPVIAPPPAASANPAPARTEG